MARDKKESQARRAEKARLTRFNNWRSTLFKKAHELSVLTASNVAMVINSADGHLFEFVSNNTSMQDILQRYQRDTKLKVEPDMPSPEENHPQIQSEKPLTEENVQHPKTLSGLSKSDKHRILASCTNEEIEQFEQLLKQAMISLLEREEKIEDKREEEIAFEEVNAQQFEEMATAQKELQQLRAEVQDEVVVTEYRQQLPEEEKIEDKRDEARAFEEANAQLFEEMATAQKELQQLRVEVQDEVFVTEYRQQLPEEMATAQKELQQVIVEVQEEVFLVTEYRQQLPEESTTGEKESEELQLCITGAQSTGMESASGTQESVEEGELYATEAEDMEVDTELRLGFPHWRL